jgi:hypothetical protein
MKLHHAAAFALVGWYLVATGNKWATDSGGGLMSAEWLRLGTCDTKTQCDQALGKVHAKVAAEYQKDRDAHRELGYHLGDAADCVPAK